MKKLTQKLVLSVITMALVVVALGTSTFAWFTLTDTARVDTFNAQVQGGNGILVSLDNVNFYTVIDSTAIQAYLTAEYGASYTLTDRTSYEGRVLRDRLENTVTDGFIEFVVYFRSDAALVIDVDGVEIGGATKQWTPDVDFIGASGTNVVAGTPITVNAYDAARVSITNVTDLSLGTDGTTTFIYKTNQTETFGDLTKGAVAYWNAVNTGSSSDITSGPDVTPTTGSFELANAALLEGASGLADQLLTLTETGAGTGIFKGAAKVRVWIEGWDPDAYNSIFNAGLTVAVQFKKQA